MAGYKVSPLGSTFGHNGVMPVPGLQTKVKCMKRVALSAAVSVMLVSAGGDALAQNKPVYRCPGNPVLYTDALSAKEAKDKGCTTLEGAPITVIASPKRTAPASGGGATVSGAVPSGSSSSEGTRVSPADQKLRDNDARRILESELRKEEDALAELKKQYNNGEPERQGDEKNYQKYLDRTAELKASLARKESDVAALRRELAKLQ